MADDSTPHPDERPPLPDFVSWPTFPFVGDFAIRRLDPPVEIEPDREGEHPSTCTSCGTSDDGYIWVDERWRVRALPRPSGLPAALVLETRSHLDLGDLSNLLATELGILTVRLERAMRSLDGVARVHVYRWGDGSAHLHVWFLARPYGRLQLRGTFLPLWDDVLPPIEERTWRENLAFVAEWLADHGGRAIAEPPPIAWGSGDPSDGDPSDGDTGGGTGDGGGDTRGGDTRDGDTAGGRAGDGDTRGDSRDVSDRDD